LVKNSFHTKSFKALYQSSTGEADPREMKHYRTFSLPEGEAIIAHDKRSAVLGQSSRRASVLERDGVKFVKMRFSMKSIICNLGEE
jgi:hypothetical protein